jgi:hypothetical protein
MNLNKLLTKKRILFIAIFALLVFLGNRINFSAIVGANNQYFTFFQFFGPIAGSFLGPIFGAVAVLVSQTADYIISGKAFTLINVLRLTPMLFAAWYFGAKKKQWTVIVPAAAIVAFCIHPVGRHAWLYSMFWLIPIVIAFLPNRNLFLRSLGATFTAHAVGSIAFIYTVPMTAAQWMGLIPVAAMERLLFAVGIAGSYLIFNLVLEVAFDKFNVKVPEIQLNKLRVIA